MITVYGIRQCDTCRKALRWLSDQGIEHRFHDFRVDGLRREQVAAWLESEFADVLVNRRSTTWRQLSEAQRNVAGDGLAQLLLDHPTLIKRPLFDHGGIVAVGFKPRELESILRE